MLKVKIERPDVNMDVTLRLRELNVDGEALDLKDLLRFLTEVARVYGFPYVQDLAAMTEYHVVPGLENKEIWSKRLAGKKK